MVADKACVPPSIRYRCKSEFFCAGYFSTTARIKDKATPLQAALARVPLLETLAVIEKLTYNCVVMPTEPKYRSIKLSNPKIKANIVDVEGACNVLELMGWERSLDAQSGEEVYVLGPKTTVTMSQVRDIQEAQQQLTRKQRDMKRSASVASLRGNNDFQAQPVA